MTFSCTHFFHAAWQKMINCACSASLKGDPPSWIAYSMPVNSSNLPSMRTKKVGTSVTCVCNYSVAKAQIIYSTRCLTSCFRKVNLCSKFSPVVTNCSRQMTRVALTKKMAHARVTDLLRIDFGRKMLKCDQN